MTHPDPDKTAAHALLADGAAVGHYKILRRIGAGGMGEVYLAQDAKLNRQVALKFLPPHLAQDPEVRARFTREAQAAAGLDHANIVTVHEVGEHAGRPYFSMQYVEGHTLRHYCREEPLALNRIPDLVAQIAEGLATAHARGLIHRDVKSANIILGPDGRPRILDFGLASVQGAEGLTLAGTTLGTAAYMSPEQAAGKPVDARSDLFSLGVVLYELVTGRLPFEGESPAAILHQIATTEPEPLARYKTGVPAELQRIVTRCLAKDPAVRYQTAADLAAELRVAGRSMAAGGSSQAEAGPPSIAVLPFANMSADPENEYFADGLTEELLNVLAKNAQLKVTGRTSSFAFKGKQEDLRGIGKKLGVATLLEGSVRKAGNRVRITAQLVNAEDGFHLWSETFDRVLEDIFAVQDEIAAAVGKALDVTLLGTPAMPAGGKRAGAAGGTPAKKAPNPEAYDLVLRANQLGILLNRQALAGAVDLYRKALDLDAEYAPAWAGLARAQGRQAGYGFSDSHAADFRRARASAERALSLDDSLAEAYEVLGWIQNGHELNFRSAAESLRKAAALAPNNPRILATLAIHHGMFERFDEALPLIQRAVELDPLDAEAYLNLGRILMWSDRWEESEAAFRRARELSPGMVVAQTLLAVTLHSQGRGDEALAEAMKEEDGGYRHCTLAVIYYTLGRKEESDRAMAALLKEREQWAFQFALAHSVREEPDQAFAWLERGYDIGDSGVAFARVQPALRNLHGDPRWKPFLKKVGLTD